VPSSGSYYNKGVEANLTIYGLFILINMIKTFSKDDTPYSDLLQYINPLTPNDLQRCRAVSPLKIKTTSKNMCEKPTNTTIIHSIY
jgi:hypothetical protein